MNAGRERILIAHGADRTTKEVVVRFIERLGFQAVTSENKDPMTWLSHEAASARFAVVLMTPDDVGGVNGAQLLPRAPQHIVFELGMLVGALRAERVAALVSGRVERPTDPGGVCYISLDEVDWRIEFGHALKAAGAKFDWNQVLAQ